MKRPYLFAVCCVLIAIFTFDSCKKEEDEFPPSITSITPTHGPVGSSVTITGNHFAGDAAVFFNGAEASVISVTTTEVVVTVPSSATSGAVSMKSNNRSAVGPDFIVEFPPAITSLTPSSGKPGDQVTINGSNFSALVGQNIVKFNGVSATVTTASTAQLGVVVPAGATTGPITVEVNALIGTGPMFAIIPPPTITSITPGSGKTGDAVTIVGTNFSTTLADNAVKFNGTTAVITSASTTQLITTVPTGATTGNILLSVKGQEVTSSSPFSIIPPPSITSVTPGSGKVGDAVAIVGTNFSTTLAENTVKFNGTTAVLTSASATQLVTTVPAGATTGNILVSVNGQEVTGSSFTVIQPPTITTISPLSGKVGDNVTIAGANFSTTTTSNEVKFNGTTATVSSATATQLVVVVPAGATSGPITVTTNTMTATGSSFTVIPPPTITSLNPVSALAGSNVTITGTNFNTTASSNTVKFNGVVATVSTATSTELVVVVPANATTGSVTVEANGMLATGPVFTVIPPVTITSFTPQAGPACTSITITGTNFSTTAADNVVKINGTAVTVTNATSTQLVVTVLSTATTGALTVTTSNQTATGSTFTVTPNEALTTMDAIDYTYANFCTAVVSNRFWISASGGFTSPKPSWAIWFSGAKPTTPGAYAADVSAERPGETWDFTPTTVNVSFDAEGRMVVSFTNVTLTPRGGAAPKLFSGTAKVY